MTIFVFTLTTILLGIHIGKLNKGEPALLLISIPLFVVTGWQLHPMVGLISLTVFVGLWSTGKLSQFIKQRINNKTK